LALAILDGLEAKMSHRLLREANEGESSVNTVAVPFSNAGQIVEGGCYHGSPLRPMKSSFSWMLVAAIIMVAVAFFMWWK